MKEKTRASILTWYFLGLVMLFIFVPMYWDMFKRLKNPISWKQFIQVFNPELPESDVSISNITFQEIVEAANSEPYIPSNSTQLQVDIIYKKFRANQNRMYLGKLVEWTGKVLSVERKYGNMYVEFIHAETNHLSDVTVEFPDKTEHNLLRLHRGDRVVYQGRIASISNGGWFNIQLIDGRIIKI